MIVVQHIQVHWTKASRGMPGAGRRNAVPLVCPLPEAPMGKGLWVQEITAHESDEFRRRHHAPATGTASRYHGLNFTPVQDRLQVFFHYDKDLHGLPHRGPQKPLQLFDLSPGQIGTFHINGRFVSTRGQFYRSHTFNITHGTTIPQDAFTGNTPHRVADWRADLF